MTTFRRTPVKSEIAGDEPLSKYALGYLNERVRNSFHDYVLRRFDEEAEKAGLTKAELARRLGLGPDRISKLLGAPGNWTLDTASELLVGICREELRPKSEPYLDRTKRNFRMEDLISNLPSARADENRQPGRFDSALTEERRRHKSQKNRPLSEIKELQS